jgi:uncharacterized protein (TIGR00369 family)
MNEVLSSIPQGFKPRSFGQGFIGANGPLYTRLFEGKLQLGFVVEERHCNPMGICHGGMLATFADMLCPITAHASCEATKGRFLPTISLQLDYLGSAPKASWVQGEAQVLRATRNMVFMQGLVTADATLIARVSGVFKIGAVFDPAQFHGRTS